MYLGAKGVRSPRWGGTRERSIAGRGGEEERKGQRSSPDNSVSQSWRQSDFRGKLNGSVFTHVGIKFAAGRCFFQSRRSSVVASQLALLAHYPSLSYSSGPLLSACSHDTNNSAKHRDNRGVFLQGDRADTGAKWGWVDCVFPPKYRYLKRGGTKKCF